MWSERGAQQQAGTSIFDRAKREPYTYNEDRVDRSKKVSHLQVVECIGTLQKQPASTSTPSQAMSAHPPIVRPVPAKGSPKAAQAAPAPPPTELELTESCDPRVLEAGEIRVRQVGCSDELEGSGEARVGDWLIENAQVRAFVCQPGVRARLSCSNICAAVFRLSNRGQLRRGLTQTPKVGR